MSKVLIDRAVLEATLEHAEFVSGAACEADDAIRAVLVAPSGTPELPVKAYYHEAPNEYGGLNKSVGLEQRREFADAPLVLEADALARIACLEGEIAKRDAKYQRDVWGLNNEGDPIGGDPAGGYANDNARLRAELSALKAQEPVCYTTQGMLEIARENWNGVQRIGAHVKKDHRFDIPLYAAPVSEAKAQGVVMPPSPYMPGSQPTDFTDYELGEIHGRIAMWEEVKRLNAAPVQQVSVQDGWKLVPVNATEAILDVLYSNGMDESDSLLQDIWSAMLAAAPAAPAADAGLVEALGYQVLFDAIAAATSVYANGAINISVQAFRAAIAAHRAKGVV